MKPEGTPGPRLVPAVGVAATDSAGAILLLRRRIEGCWCLPGGHLEPGETWLSGAMREFREETGREVAVQGLLGIYSDPSTQTYGYPDGDEAHLVGAVFFGLLGPQIAAPDGEAAEIRLFPPDRLPELFPPDRPVLDDLLSGVPRPVIR